MFAAGGQAVGGEQCILIMMKAELLVDDCGCSTSTNLVVVDELGDCTVMLAPVISADQRLSGILLRFALDLLSK